MVYHFTTFKSFYDMVDKDVIQFSLAGGLSDKYLNGTYGNGAKYFLSTTRVRDGRFGYSQGLNVRLEINSDAFNSNFSAGPVDFFYKSKFILPFQWIFPNSRGFFKTIFDNIIPRKKTLAR